MDVCLFWFYASNTEFNDVAALNLAECMKPKPGISIQKLMSRCTEKSVKPEMVGGSDSSTKIGVVESYDLAKELKHENT